MIYSNGLPERVVFPAEVPLTRPLIRRVPGLGTGVRVYALGNWTLTSRGSRPTLLVTPAGHRYTGDDSDGELWTCRGCRAAAETGEQLDLVYGRCPRPPSQQDVASALLARTAVAA